MERKSSMATRIQAVEDATAVEVPASQPESRWRCPRTTASLWTTAWATWSSLQVGHHGKYSIKRLMTLHTYYIEKESLLRSIGMCVLTPLPALLSIVLAERTPLQPPSEASTTN